VCIENAWLLKRRTSGSVSDLDFRREIATHYCSIVADRSKIETAIKKQKVPNDFRYDGLFHYVVESQRRCAYQFCKSRTESN
jgi:hypothetical protein